jgi:hypothetical protein
MEAFNIAASIASIILAVVAIWQAVHFYTQGKNTESRVETALSSIKAQVETLQSINGRTLDRLTKYATTPREDGSSQAAQALSTALRDLPAIFLQFKVPSQDSTQAVMRKEIVSCYICMWYYTATANINASFSLPSVDEFDENNPYHAYIKDSIDRSFADFKYMSGIIHNIGADEINSSFYLNLYDEVKNSLINYVGDTAQYFSRKVHASNT